MTRLTKNISTLYNRWGKVYLNILSIGSMDVEDDKDIKNLQDHAKMFNRLFRDTEVRLTK